MWIRGGGRGSAASDWEWVRGRGWRWIGNEGDIEGRRGRTGDDGEGGKNGEGRRRGMKWR